LILSSSLSILPRSLPSSEFNYVCGEDTPWEDECDGERRYDAKYMNGWLRRRMINATGNVRGHMAPQYPFLVEKRNRVRMADHVLRLENLASEFPRLMRAFRLENIQAPEAGDGWLPDDGLATNTMHMTVDFLAVDTVNMINEMYSDDFEALGYQKRNG